MNRDETSGPDPRTEGRVTEWLGDGPSTLPEHVLQDVIQQTNTTPQARRRLLGRWLDRGEGAGRRTADHDPPPTTNRRSRLMLSATGITAALAILALTVNVVDTDTPPPQAAATRVVDAGGSTDYATIGSAVAAASDGDTIEVLSGEYIESLLIDKDIKIMGEPRGVVVIQAPEPAPRYELRGTPMTETRYALAVVDAEVELSGLTLRGRESRVILDGVGARLTGNSFDGVGVTYQGSLVDMGAIVTLGDSDVMILDNEFAGGDGPFSTEGVRATIEENIFLDGSSIAGEFAAGSEIQDNVFTGDGTVGVSLLGPSDVTIAGNTIRDRFNAIRSRPDLGPVFAGDVRANIISGASTAISVNTIDGARIADNVIRDGRVGIQLDGSNADVSGNEITGHEGIAIGVFGGSPVLEGNVVIGNKTGLSVAGGATPTLSGNLICDNQTDVAALGEIDLAGNTPCDEVGME